MLPETLRTERLLLRPVAAADAAVVVEALGDFQVTGWLRTVPFPYSRDDFDHFLAQIARPGGDFAIDDGAGFCGLVGIDTGREFGYWLCPHAQGRGYATEAARAVLSAAFARNPAPVRSGYFEGNDRSARVQDKLGFQEVARTMEFCVARGMDLAHITTSLDPAAFAKAAGCRSAP